ncbi:MAG: putative 2-aminoethylphosphonate ABC transporter substrate-binding protein [Clostridiales bacterium]|nr:putative 2-aminoethylphosphonate ABC transporter substrate-binding protein [Clostridiales bacterium]
MKKNIVIFIAVLMIATVAVFVASCSGTTSPTVENGGSETESRAAEANETEGVASGEITVYTALEDEQVEEYLEVFNAKHPGIKVNIYRESTGVVTAKLLAEKSNPVADVVWGTAASSLLVLDDQNMLEPYAPEGVGNILAQFKSSKPVPTWVGIDVWETAFTINTVELEKLGLAVSDISSYEDLLRPELKGHVVMSNPSSSGTGLLTVTGLLQLKGKGTGTGWDFLTQLHENIDQYVHSGSKPAKMAGAGECVIGVSFGYAGIKQVRDGNPVVVVFPSEGSGWDLEANALLKKDSIDPAAKVFLDWAISDEAMNLYKANYPILANGKGGKYDGFSSDPVDQLIDNDLVWVASNRESVLYDWTEKFDGKSAPQK